ncbi:hypothetical protein BW723_10355 [Polaribacter reichenbachii]|uniref:SxtJ n=1 Tax=Polaribacter reichenbachii TaxID=996801 RepID=A0A1B8TNQ5_9FLAO|nr:hypothetical protein [Polaribacter reichenbachii]APZ46666.1 hypothetical protein BW723_10355 [Polaribacter reichenbachii]AUC17309.1 hypothetical protein BTO17_00800 [Polaribacter reichenbachii]OBY61243.1 hypothetical protein LPB301_17400 [Polaribacter reichenbachii]
MKKEKTFETIIVLALASLICFLLFNVKWLVYLSVVFLVIPLISLKIALIIANIWLTFSNYLGLIMNYILMFVCFYFILVPISFLQKVFGGNQILKKQKGDSYFIKRNHLFTKNDIKNPW